MRDGGVVTSGNESAGEAELQQAYDRIRAWLDGDSEDLRAYEALDYLYLHARAHLGLPDPFGGRTAEQGPRGPVPRGTVSG
jgi:hypothetical protein